MPMYRALTKCHVGGAVRKEGEVFEWNGPENSNLEEVGEPKPEAKPTAKRTVKAKADAEGTA